MFEINVWTIAAINSFSRCMEMNSISDPTYRNINEQLCKAYEIAANNGMKRAADMKRLLLLQHTKVTYL